MTPRKKVPVHPGVPASRNTPVGEWLCVTCGKHLRPCLCGFASCTKIPRHVDTGRVPCERADLEARAG